MKLKRVNYHLRIARETLVKAIADEYISRELRFDLDTTLQLPPDAKVFKYVRMHVWQRPGETKDSVFYEDKDFMMVIKPFLIQDAVKKAFKKR